MINLTLDTVMKSLQEIGQFIVWIALGVAALEVLLYFLLHRLFPTKNALAYMLLAPALIGIAFLIIYPFAFEVYLAFTDMSLKTARNPTFSLQNGIDNFRAVFTSTVAHKASFWQVLRRTVLWTVINVVFHVSGGMVLALLLNRPMRLRGLYRTLLVFPWAIPQPIAAMSLRNQFNYLYGFFNVIIRAVNKPLLAAAEARLALANNHTSELATRSNDGLRRCMHLQYLARHSIHERHHPRRPSKHLKGILRSGGDGWSLRLESVSFYHLTSA